MVASSITVGQVHDFVARWLAVIYGNAELKNMAHKDWRLLESLSLEGLELHRNKKGAQLISLDLNRKTKPIHDNRFAYKTVTQLVLAHCIESELTLPGFYAFLRALSELRHNLLEIFKVDDRLSNSCNDLITGYWEKVKPTLHDVVYSYSDNMGADLSATQAADLSAIQGIQNLTEEVRSAAENDLDPRLPFQAVNRIAADLKQAQQSRPTSAPTPTMGS